MNGRRGLRRFGAIVAWLAAASVFVAAPALADGGDARLVLRQVDAVKYPDVALTVMPVGAKPASYKVSENGKDVGTVKAQTALAAKVPVGVVFLVDTGTMMKTGNALDQLKEALIQVMNHRGANEQYALMSFGITTRILANFSSDQASITAAINALQASNTRDESVLRDASRAALAMLGDNPSLQPNLVIISGSTDSVSSSSMSQLQGDIIDAAASVRTIGIKTKELDSDALKSLASVGTATYTEVSDPARVGDALAAAQNELANQDVLTYTGTKNTTVVDLQVAAGNLQAHATFNAGAITAGRNLNPTIFTPSLGDGPEFLRGTNGKYIGAGLALAAFILLAFGIGLVMVRDRSALETVLQPYSEGFVADSDDDGSQGSFAETKFIQKAVALTSQIATNRGFLPRVERALEMADLPLRAAEAIFFYISGAVVLTALFIVLTKNLFVGLLALLVFVLLPPAALNYLAGRRRRKFMSQLPDTLQLLAGSLRAGYSLMQGVEAVSQEVDDPMGRELRRVVVESRLGRPLEVALDDSAARMGSPDFEWAVMAIRIQREVGGNLAELLLTVAETMVHRERLRRDVKALTAEGKVSAIVLGILPPGLGVAMWVINPEYINKLFTDRLGNYMLGGSIVLALVGFYWMKKCVEIEV